METLFCADLKPRNLLVNSNCDLKICDYGLLGEKLLTCFRSKISRSLTDEVGQTCHEQWRLPAPHRASFLEMGASVHFISSRTRQEMHEIRDLMWGCDEQDVTFLAFMAGMFALGGIEHPKCFAVGQIMALSIIPGGHIWNRSVESQKSQKTRRSSSTSVIWHCQAEPCSKAIDMWSIGTGIVVLLFHYQFLTRWQLKESERFFRSKETRMTCKNCSDTRIIGMSIIVLSIKRDKTRFVHLIFLNKILMARLHLCRDA